MIAFNLLAVFFVLSAPLGLGSGLAKSRFRALPAVVVGAMVVIYLAGVSSATLWAAECWDCAYGNGAEPLFGRSVVPPATAIVGAAALAITFVTAWLGTRLSSRRAS